MRTARTREIIAQTYVILGQPQEALRLYKGVRPAKVFGYIIISVGGLYAGVLVALALTRGF